MYDSLLSDTIQSVKGTIAESEPIVSFLNNYWFWISIVELLIILYLIFFQKKTETTREKFKREALEKDIDLGNIINSAFHVKPLYDELKVKCHPDRFPNDVEKSKVALELFQQITKNKTNYNKLIELKELAKQKLNINF